MGFSSNFLYPTSNQLCGTMEEDELDTSPAEQEVEKAIQNGQLWDQNKVENTIELVKTGIHGKSELISIILEFGGKISILFSVTI